MRSLLLLAAALFGLAACERESGVMTEIRRAEQERLARQAAITAQSARFMEEKRRAPGVRATRSGLVYEVTREAPDPNLPRPPREALVRVNYEGRLPDGTVFDSSDSHGGPAEFSLAGGVIPGFAEILLLMRPGEEVVAYLPPELAYGEKGARPAIPPNVALQFRIELLAFARPDGTVVVAPSGGGRSQ